MQIVLSSDQVLPYLIPLMVFLLFSYFSGKIFASKNPFRLIFGTVLLSVVLEATANSAIYFYLCLITFFIPVFMKLRVHSLIFYTIQTLLYSCIRIPSLIFSGFGRSSERYSGRYEDMYEENASSSRNNSDNFNSEREAWKRREEARENEFRQREAEFNRREREFEQRRSQASGSQTMSYEVALNLLGLREPFNQRELKKAFRSTSNQYHPDKNIGATEAVKKMAEEKMKEVLQAQRIISSKKGW